jgi:uncharacterized protein YaaW (UPF0174 family)
MNNPGSPITIDRKTFIKNMGIASVAILAGCRTGDSASSVTPIPKDPLLPYIYPDQAWDSGRLDAFLSHLQPERQELVLQSLGMEGKPYSVDEIKKQMVWLSSSFATYPFKNKSEVGYHEIVQWVAGKYGVAPGEIKSAPTFTLEHRLLEQVFVEAWDKLDYTQRMKVLGDIEQKNGALKNKAAIALMGGTTALGALSVTVATTGFAFYSSISVAIFTVAELLGVTLPFTAYTTTSSTIAAFTGPVGWTLLALGAAGLAALVGAPSESKTAAFIVQLHLIKVDALEKSGELASTMKQLAILPKG